MKLSALDYPYLHESFNYTGKHTCALSWNHAESGISVRVHPRQSVQNEWLAPRDLDGLS